MIEYPYLTEEAIDRAAAALLQRAFGGPWRERRPVDLEDLVYEYLSPEEGLSFNDEAELLPEDGETVLGKTVPVRSQILLNRVLKGDADPGRMRFTLGHEIGHWVLHRRVVLEAIRVRREVGADLFGEAPPTAEEFAFVGLNRTTFPRSCAPGAVRREEWQANRFAAALLVDSVVLREEFEARFGPPPVARATQTWRYRAASVRDLAQLLARSLVGVQCPLREVFGLSAEAMAIALESRGYVTESAPAI